ncbi:MAG: Thymidylate kinase [Chaenotheca gracillima]|nr:MAG: Thymidylate kinase [Chaenotheca gracillima]
MEDVAQSDPDQLPDRMLSFQIFNGTVAGPMALGARLGRLCVAGRKAIPTPNHIAITSRGAVPHISQDMMRQHTDIEGVYVALEDSANFDASHWSLQVIEKAPRAVPPVYKYASAQRKSFQGSAAASPLRSFIALQEDAPLMLAPRRIPSVPCPASNTNAGISIYTSVGFRTLDSEDYAEAIKLLSPDLVVGMGDLVHNREKGPSNKRLEKMGDRTTQWTQDMVDARNERQDDRSPALLAPILPIEPHQQNIYLSQLEDEWKTHVSGLAIYDSDIIPDLPVSLSALPRFSLDTPSSPHKLLTEISLGADVFVIPFIGAATDAGIALDFSFPPSLSPEDPPTTSAAPAPLGIDMWSTQHASDLSPLRPECTCHACQKHTRAYVQHLLQAKEMLGWVLLQIHNLHVLDTFFSGVRNSLSRGCFEQDRAVFDGVYEAELPEKTGQGPRVRGYHHKTSGPNAPKANPSAFRTLNDASEKLEESKASINLASPATSATVDPTQFATKLE